MNKKRLLILFALLCLFSLPLCAANKNDAKTLVQNGQYAQAIAVFESIAHQPSFAKDADAQKLMGQAYCMLGRYAEALPHLERAVSLNSKSGALWYLSITRQHLYDYEGAIDALETYMPFLHSDSWKERADSLMNICEIGQRAFEHTLDVVVIDSILVGKTQFFEHYKLGDESGRILSSDGDVYFENQSGDHRIFCQDSKLYECHKFQDKWDEFHRLEGVGSEQFQVLDPFLLSDGETLYFASDSLPGLGGLDIYKTTFDAEEGRFYQPERLGMPFNSPYDDYMMAIDEAHQVGWWATERNAAPDSVMIYLFLFDPEAPVLDEPTTSRARVDCIAETWKVEGGYQTLLDEIFNPTPVVDVSEMLHVVVAPGVVYTDVSQFRNPKAQEAYLESEAKWRELADAETNLAAERRKFASSKNSLREPIKARILQLEETVLALQKEHEELVLRYRSLEGEILR